MNKETGKEIVPVRQKLSRNTLLRFLYLLGACGVRRAGKRRDQAAMQNPRILLLHPGPLGAIVLTSPVLHALKTAVPGAHVTMMVGPWSSEVVQNHPDLDQLLVFNFPSYRSASPKGLKSYVLLLQTAWQLRRGNFDLAINLHRNFWWGSVLLYLAGIPHRIGYNVQPGTPFLTRALTFPSQEHVTVSRLLAINAALHALGYPPMPEPYTPERYPLYFMPGEAEQAWAAEFLASEGITPATQVIVIHPGTSVEVKQWRAEAWASCASELSETLAEDSPVHILLTGSKKELPMLEKIAESTPAKTTIVTNTTIGQLAALLRRADLVLGVDSGPLHLAVAQDTPTVRLFGPTDPRRYSAWGNPEKHAVVVTTHRCATCPAIPCGRLHFQAHELAAHPCVQLIPEQEVLNVISTLLSRVKMLDADSVQTHR